MTRFSKRSRDGGQGMDGPSAQVSRLARLREVALRFVRDLKKHSTKDLGSRGERLAVRYLKRQGYRILKSNYVCPLGEIDIIAADGDMLVFVEVKTRRSDVAADPENAVNFHKRRQVTRAAKHFLGRLPNANLASRFDIVSVVIPEKGEPAIEHFMDAFAPTPR